MKSPFQVSEQMLGQASIGRNLPGMVSPVRPGPNAYDQGGASKAAANTQPYNNERLAMQNAQQNVLASSPQQVSDAMGKVRAGHSEQTNSEAKAQQLLTQRMSEALYANESGSALMRLNSVMQGPDRAKFVNDIATGKAMAAGISPDLGAVAASSRQYG